MQILLKLIETQQNKEKQNIKKSAYRFIIEKSNGKSMNAYNWMETFEKKCTRFDIVKDEEKKGNF